jgi:hypothetical protein
MALISCSECRGQVSDKAAACPHCGAPVTFVAVEPQPVPVQIVKPKSNLIWWVLGTPVALFAVFLVIGARTNPNSPSLRASVAKDECEKTAQKARVVVDCDKIATNIKSDLESPQAPGVTQADIDAALADGAAKAQKPYRAPVWPKP